MNTPKDPLSLLNSLEAVRKFRRTPITSNLRKRLDELEDRIAKLEKLLDAPAVQEEPEIPQGFFPIHHYFTLKPDVSETQVRKWLDDGVENKTVEVGRWRSPITKKFCKWYRPTNA